MLRGRHCTRSTGSCHWVSSHGASISKIRFIHCGQYQCAFEESLGLQACVCVLRVVVEPLRLTNSYIDTIWSFDLSDDLQPPHCALVLLTYFLHLLSLLCCIPSTSVLPSYYSLGSTRQVTRWTTYIHLRLPQDRPPTVIQMASLQTG